jgi:hypothetical protein
VRRTLWKKLLSIYVVGVCTLLEFAVPTPAKSRTLSIPIQVTDCSSSGRSGDS